MIIINDRKVCEHCFSETTLKPCPFCGFDKNLYKPDPAALPVGSVLNQRYLIGGVIGKGGFGITYLAYDNKLDTKIAVKEYYPTGVAVRSPQSTHVSATNKNSEEPYKNGAEKFYNEAKMVARFNGNPNIVSVHDFFYENDTVYFTMGYLEGQTLKSYSEGKKLSEGQAVKVFQDISNALLAAHSLNILHRDVSPDNIMLCKDGTIRLLDFGAARQVMAEQSQSLSVILKQGYAPLEQYQKKGKQGPWTDIYALGATIYHCITGDNLDDPMSRLEDDSDYGNNKYGISDKLWQIIKKSTSLKIDDRYQDVFELKKDLNNVGIEQETINDIVDDTKSAFDFMIDAPSADISKSTGMSSDENATVYLQQDTAVHTGYVASNEAMANTDKAPVKAKAPARKGIKKPLIIAVCIFSAVLLSLLGLLIYKVVSSGKKTSVVRLGSDGYFNNLYLREKTEFQYYVDLDGNLRMIAYDEDDSIFYVDESEIIYSSDDDTDDDSVGYLNMSEDKLYFVYFGGNGNDDAVMMSDRDGSNVEELFELPGDSLSGAYLYAALSDDNEYLYYMADKSADIDSGDADLLLYRYNLNDNDGKDDKVVKDEIIWYTLHDRYIYYIKEIKNKKSDLGYDWNLYRSLLDGSEEELLNDRYNFNSGFFDSDKLYMLQITDEDGEYKPALVQYTEDGEEITDGRKNYEIDEMVTDGIWTYGGGFIYYVLSDSRELCRLSYDGASKRTIATGFNFSDLSYDDGYLCFRDGYYNEDGYYQSTQLYIMRNDGSNMVSMGTDTDYLVDENGLRFVIIDGVAYIAGYEGKSVDVVIPDTFNGYEVNGNIYDGADMASLNGLNAYKTASPMELQYSVLQDGGIFIDKYTGAATGSFADIAIPSSINGEPVLAIGDEAFKGVSLEKLYLPDGLLYIGEEAFAGTGLERVVFPDTLQIISEEAFSDCSFKDQQIVLPQSLTTIGRQAFQNCSPQSIYIPASVSDFDYGFLAGCGGEYIADPESEILRSQDGVLYMESPDYPDIYMLLAYPYDRTGEFDVPDNVLLIMDYAFNFCKISGVTLPENLYSIGRYSFNGCNNIKSIIIPESVKVIDHWAFHTLDLGEVTISRDCECDSEAFKEGVEIKYYGDDKPASDSQTAATPTVPDTQPAPSTPAVTTVTNQPYTFVTSKFSVSGTYTGEWLDGKPNGKGTMTMLEHNNDRWGYGDTLYSANWVNGLIQGYGQWRSSEFGGAYDGNFVNGLKEGYGKMYFTDGTVYDGQWSKGDFIG